MVQPLDLRRKAEHRVLNIDFPERKHGAYAPCSHVTSYKHRNLEMLVLASSSGSICGGKQAGNGAYRQGFAALQWVSAHEYSTYSQGICASSLVSTTITNVVQVACLKLRSGHRQMINRT
jgi:hypothetical protein